MRLSPLLSLVIVAGAAFAPPAAAGTPPPQVAAVSASRYRAGAVLVRFKPEAAKSGHSALAAEGLEVTQEIPEIGVLAVAVPQGEEAATAARLAGRGDVAYAELDYIASAQVVPNDSNYGKQWGLEQIGAPQAWEVTTGASDIVIAVVDSGIDLEHEDLEAKVWRNTGEIAFNGKDDDGNGYVDDVEGWHFYTNGAGGDWLVSDDNGHGTHVSGIAAAATNNGKGVAGVAWDSPIMTVKVLGSDATGPYSSIAAGIIYAVDNGARIINLSLGGESFSQTLCNAVTTATSKGRIVVAASGNDGPAILYPAMCPGALAVAATDASDEHASFSNAGSRIDLAAPGVNIWSTWYASLLHLGTYASRGGTSQAAPFVSGAAALVWSRWPGLTAGGVKAQLLATAKDVGQPGKDDETGWGRLDVAAAVAAPAPDVDLRLGAAVAPQTVIAGNPLTATFTITNAGANAATSMTLEALLVADPLIEGIQSGSATCRLNGPEMICGASRLEPGASITVSVVMTPTQVGTGELTTTGSVAAAQQELTPGDNQQTVKSLIRPALSGRVFVDSNGDGIRQAWETRGVTGAGLYVEQNGQPVAYQASQSPDGAYHFDTLPLGAYVLRAELPPDLQATTPQEIALLIEPARETVVYFGAWNGVVEPTPTITPTPTPGPSPSPTPTGVHSRTYLPLIVR